MLKKSDLDKLAAATNVTIDVVPVKRFDVVADVDGKKIVLDSADTKANANKVVDWIGGIDLKK